MIPDDIDTYIFKAIFNSYKNDEDADFYQIAKDLACEIKESDHDNVYRRIKQRIKKYVELRILTKKLNGSDKYVYEMNEEVIAFGRHKFGDKYQVCLLLRIS